MQIAPDGRLETYSSKCPVPACPDPQGPRYTVREESDEWLINHFSVTHTGVAVLVETFQVNPSG